MIFIHLYLIYGTNYILLRMCTYMYIVYKILYIPIHKILLLVAKIKDAIYCRHIVNNVLIIYQLN